METLFWWSNFTLIHAPLYINADNLQEWNLCRVVKIMYYALLRQCYAILAKPFGHEEESLFLMSLLVCKDLNNRKLIKGFINLNASPAAKI